MSAFRILAVLLISTLSMSVRAQVENQDYQRLSPARAPSTQGKVEVLEFFSYGCPHCYTLHPLISKWSVQLPANAVFVRVPVSLGRREWGQLVRTHYALEFTGDLARLDGALFGAIHKEKQPLFDEESITAWVARQGVDAGKFRQAFNSFDISTKASRAEQLSRNYAVSAVPQLSVDGKYVVTGKTHADTLRIARQLVDRSAAEKQANLK